MGWRKILTYGFLSCFLCSCLNYIHSPNGGTRPKKSKFYLQENPYKLQKEDLIDSENIYLSTDTLKYGDGEFKTTSYMKFFKNGRCYRNSIDISKMSNIAELTFPSTVGYYTIIDHSKIEIEFFYVKHKERGWYIKDEGFIKNDTLFIKEINNQGNEIFIPYIPKKIKGLSKTTDW